MRPHFSHIQFHASPYVMYVELCSASRNNWIEPFFTIFFCNFSVTSQHFEVDIFRENVIAGNDAIFKCSVPSFVSDFVTIESWVDSEGNVLSSQLSGNHRCSVMILSISVDHRNPFLILTRWCCPSLHVIILFSYFSDKSKIRNQHLPREHYCRQWRHL